jgi:hypothetical protein
MSTKPTKGKSGPTTSGPEGKIPDLTIRNAQLMYKNFGGAAKRFNAAGLRNFHVKLDLKTAAMLLNDGWNIKYDEPREEGDKPVAHMKVNFSFDKFPPRILLISGKDSKNRSVLDAESVGTLDWAEIEKIDLVLSGSRWEKGSDFGIKTWLRKAFVTLSPNDLESEYMASANIDNIKTVDEEDD